MSTPLGAMKIELGLETNSFNNGLTSAKRAVSYFKSEANALDKILKNNGNSIQALVAKNKALQSAYTSQLKVLSNLKNKQDGLKEGTAAWEANAAAIEKENVKLIDLKNQLDNVATALKNATSQTSFFEGLQNVGKKLKSVGDGMIGIADKTKFMSAGISGGITLAVKSAMEFESAMAGVNKTVNGTPEQLKAIENGIRSMALEIPATTTEIAGVAEAAGQLGIATDDVLDFTRVMMELGTATNLSAEEAATALAQFTNITGMSKDKIRNLGDTIVALGNNSATTEKDIVNLATRLAGAGNQVGLTEAEIMGLSAAMASVGLSAEAGGTAMSTIMTKINKAVASGGESLQNFASIAGVSAEEFSSKWKSSPTEALELFTKGLGKALEEGKNIDQMLADLGVTGIRETDTIKRLASAGELMGDSFKLANESFNESGALANEASTRYETLESKIQLLKNKLNDLGIEFGGPFVDALTQAMDSAKPLLEWASEMAEKFSNLDKDTQETIVKIVAFAAAFSPLMKIMGETTNGVGLFIEGVGKIPSAFDKVKSGFDKGAEFFKVITKKSSIAKTTLEEVDGVTTVLTTNATGLSGALSMLGGTGIAALAVGAGVAMLAIGALAENTKAAKQRAEEWGTAVSGTQARDLQNFKDKVDEVDRAMSSFGKNGVGNLEELKSALSDVVAEISKLAEDDATEKIDLAKKLGFSAEEIKKVTDNANKMKENIVRGTQELANQITKIHETAKNEKRSLSEQEQAIVRDATNKLIQQELDLMNFSNKEKKALMQAFNGEVEQLTDAQFNKQLKTLQKWHKEEQASYKEQKNALKELYDADLIDKKTYHDRSSALEAEHKEKMESYQIALAEMYAARAKEIANNAGTSYEERKFALKQLQKQAKEYGLTWEQIEEQLDNAGVKNSTLSKMLADTTTNLSENTQKANSMWNKMIWDDKKADVKSNVKDVVKESLEAENGWTNLQFIIKEANLTSNAKIEVARAIQEAGRWDELTPEEKELLIDNNETIQKISESNELWNTWNSLPEEVKEMLGDNSNFMQNGEEAESFLNSWNSLTPEDKELVAKDMTENGVSSAKKTLKSIEDGTYKAKVEAEDKTKEQAPGILGRLKNMFGGEQVKTTITAEDKTKDVISDIKRELESVKDKDITVNAQANGADQVKNLKESIDQMPESKTSTSTVNVKGKGQQDDLNKSIDSQKNKTTASKANVSGKNKQDDLNKSINSQKNKTTTSKANVHGKGDVDNLRNSINNLQNKTVTVTTIVREVKQKAKGDNNFEGGLAMVNDQKGSLYKELITLPSGRSFIPEGRDVVMPLPKGTKILRASKTKQLMNNMGIPRFADGVGIPSDAKFMRDIERATVLPSKRRDSYLDTDRIVDGLTELETKVVRVLKALLNKDSTIVLDGAVLSEKITKRQTKSTRLANRMNGVVT